MNNLTISTQPFTTTNPAFPEVAVQCTDLWNAAWGDEFALSSRAFTWPASQPLAQEAVLLFAYEANLPVGFLLASYQLQKKIAHLEALAVIPEAQQQDVGQLLWTGAQSALSMSRRATWKVEESPLSLLPGVPENSFLETFLANHNFQFNESHLRASIDVASYVTPQTIKEVDAAVYPAKPTDYREILNFLNGYSAKNADQLVHFVVLRRRLSDLMLLWTETGLAGICWLGFEDSPYPIELSFPYRLPRPWAQVRQLLLAPQLGDEYLATLLDASLRRFHNNGVNSAVITTQLRPPMWEQFQLQPYQTFRLAVQSVSAL